MTIDIKKRRELLANGTARPWLIDVGSNGRGEDFCVNGIYGPDKTVDYGSGPETWPQRIVETDSGYYPPERPDALLICAAVNDYEMLLRVAEAVGDYHDASRDGSSTDAYNARERLFDLVREFKLSPTDLALEAIAVIVRARGKAP